ncbi:MAG TPA: hypothetical protein VF749_06465 [Candidatus Acidoferrum sp.]
MASKTESEVRVWVGMTPWKIRLGAEGLSVHWAIRPALADVTLTVEPLAESDYRAVVRSHVSEVSAESPG